jgi:EmrB/QacA subfamily drug resistance transporter
MSEATPKARSAMTPAQRATLIATILGSAMVFLDGTVVNLALAAMGQDLPISIVSVFEGQTYIVTGYFASLAALLVLAGALSDHYGRRRIYMIGLAGFATMSVLCGFAPSLELLILFRVLQGAAGALLVPGSLSLITSVFEGAARARAIGIWAAATSAATVLGPVIGGILVDSVGWRAIFLLNVPVLAVALWLSARSMPESKDPDAPDHFDWLGAIVAGIAVGGLAFGAIRANQQGLDDPVALVALLAGIVAVVSFPILMVRRTDPLIPPSLFRLRTFTVVNVSTFLLYGALYVSIQFLFLFLIGVVGFSPLGAALAVLPVNLALALLSTRVGTVAGHHGPRRFLTAGPILVAVAFGWIALAAGGLDPWSPSWDDPRSFVPPSSVAVGLLGAMTIYGLGMALVVAPLTTTLMSSIPIGQAGLGSAINNAVSRVGQPLLAAVAFILVTTLFYSTLAAAFPAIDFADPGLRTSLQPLNPPGPTVPPDIASSAASASTDAFRAVMVVCAVLSGLAALVNARGLRPSPELR